LTYGQDIKAKTKALSIPSKQKDSILKKDSLLLKKPTDTLKKDSLKTKKSAIEFIITHDADDYVLQDAKNKQTILYNNAHVIYGDIDLKAGIIIVDNKNNTLFAKGIKDSLGYQQRHDFKNGTEEQDTD